MADERPAKRRRFTSEVVTLKVGTGEVGTFTAHSELLKEYSPFFKAALDNKWKESQSTEITLPDDEPDTVEAYLVWLHHGEINPRDPTGDEVRTFPFLASLYVFGEKIQDDVFCNGVIDMMTETLDNQAWGRMHPSPEAVYTLYEGTPKGSPVRSLFSSYFARNHTFTDDDPRLKECHRDFITDALVFLSHDRRDNSEYLPLYPERELWYKVGHELMSEGD